MFRINRKHLNTVCFWLLMFSITGCGKKIDATETFPVVETQDESQFLIDEEIILETIPNTGEASLETENRVSSEEIESLSQEIDIYGRANAPLIEIESKLTDSEKKALDDIVINKSSDYEEIISGFSSLGDEEKQIVIDTMENQLHSLESPSLPEELKDTINIQNQKEVEEGLEILESYFEEQKAGE